MLVCHCLGVHERQIRRAIADGASDLGGVARVCEAGSGCGDCVRQIRRIIQEEALVGRADPDGAETAAMPALSGAG